MIQWVAANWQAVVSIGSMVLAIGVAVAHLIHKDDVAQKLQSVEDTINSLAKK